MSYPKKFATKESLSALRPLQKSSSPMIGKRLHALLVSKQHEQTGISKLRVAKPIGANDNSVQIWRNLYISGGITALTSHSNVGYKPSVFTQEQEQALEKKLQDPDNGIVGFVELLSRFNTEFNAQIRYKTLHGFVCRQFQAKVKTARKVHVKKDPAGVADFKKLQSAV